jgi:hypothetical protein
MLQLKDSSLGAVVAPLETLADVLALGWTLVSLVVQDEYTHDAVVQAGERVLVFETS